MNKDRANELAVEAMERGTTLQDAIADSIIKATKEERRACAKFVEEHRVMISVGTNEKDWCKQHAKLVASGLKRGE